MGTQSLDSKYDPMGGKTIARVGHRGISRDCKKCLQVIRHALKQLVRYINSTSVIM